MLPLIVFQGYVVLSKNNSSAFLPNSIGFLMMSYHLELCNYICSDCAQVADSHLTPGYCSQNSKLEREENDWIAGYCSDFISYFLS